MKIRAKAVRRLLILCVSAALVGGSVTAGFYARRQARDARTAAARADGLAAYAVGDYAAALPSLQAYVAAKPTDVGALFALAVSCEQVETANHGNLFEARTRYQQVLLRDPTHLPAKRRLLVVYDQLGLYADLLTIADDVIASTGSTATSGDGLRYRATALARLDRSGEAVAAWRAYLWTAPTDFRAQGELLDAMRRAGTPGEQVVAYARGVADAHPNDAALRLPLANALRTAGQEDEARTILARLAADAPKNPALIIDLVATLDRARSFDDAERLLAKAADGLDSSTLSHALVLRAWQNGRHAQVIATTQRLLAAGRREPSLVALRALSLAATARGADAASLAAELAARPSDATAAAWADVLAVELEADQTPTAHRLDVLRSAVVRDGDNGLFHAWLGHELLATGDADQAARHLREAALRMPSWPVPCVELSEAMLVVGRLDEAIAAAKAAYLRSPSSASTQLQVVRVRFAELQKRRDPTGEAALLKSVTDLCRQLPDAATLVPIEAELLMRGGRTDEAERVIKAAVLTAHDPDAFAGLYLAVRRGDPATADVVCERAVAQRSVSPALASMRAADLAERSGPAAALAFTQAQLAGHAGDARFALADARLRSSLDDPSAREAWTRLADAFPADLAAQVAVMSEASTLIGDRDVQARVVERIRGIAGETGTPWRLARVRFLATSTDAGELRQALALATELVRERPDRTDLRVALARLLVRLDGTSAALDHLRVAFEAAPDNAWVGLEYAATLRRAGRPGDVPAVLTRLASFDHDGDGRARRALAAALVDSGLYDVAAVYLGRAAAIHALDAPGRLVLAEVQVARGDVAAAAASFNALCADAIASPAALASAAAFERRAGHADRAAALVARLDALPPGRDRSLASARYAVAFADADAADHHYAEAVDAPTADAATFREAMAYAIARHDPARSTALLRRAGQRFPNDDSFRRAASEANATTDGAPGGGGAMTTLIAAIARDPSAAEADAVRSLAASPAVGPLTPALATALVALASEYPGSLDLAGRAIEASLGVGERDAATRLAYRVLAHHAGEADASALAARTLARCGNLPAARQAASDWRRLSAANPRDADALLAAISLAGGDAGQAIATLEPCRATMNWPADAAMFATLAEADVRLGDVAAGFAVIRPALATQGRARAIWLSMSVRVDDDAAAADRIATLADATPVDANDERAGVAAAYLEIAERSGRADCANRGLSLLDAMTTPAKGAKPNALLRADLLRVRGSPDLAILVLRDALKATPGDAALGNALAYLLLNDPTTAGEAERLASGATVAMPSEPTYFDTLARASLAKGDEGAAERHFRTALRLDPRCIDAQVGLALLQTGQGRVADARATLKQVDDDVASFFPRGVPLRLQNELRSSRERVASASN